MSSGFPSNHIGFTICSTTLSRTTNNNASAGNALRRTTNNKVSGSAILSRTPTNWH